MNIDTSIGMNINDNVNTMILLNIINNMNIDTSKKRDKLSNNIKWRWNKKNKTTSQGINQKGPKTQNNPKWVTRPTPLSMARPRL